MHNYGTSSEWMRTVATPIKGFATVYRSSHGLDCGACALLIQKCTDNRLVRQGKQIHAHIILNSVIPNNYLASKLLTFYSKSGCISHARNVFDEIPRKNIFSWNAMFIAYSLHKQYNQTLTLFYSLLTAFPSSSSLKPDNFTITCVLKALSALFPEPNLPQVFHAFVLRHGYECDTFVANALVTFYARSGNFSLGRKLFDTIPQRDIVSWNSMIAGYSQSGLYHECLDLYNDMVGAVGLKPNGVTMVSVLQACAQSNDIVLGIKIHRHIIDNNIELDAAVCNTIVGLYAKCGVLDYAREVFDGMIDKDDISYGSMISGYMIHGFVDKAMKLFRQMKIPSLSTWNAVLSGLVQNKSHEQIPCLLREMQATGFRPNSVTLSSVLPTFASNSNLKCGKQIHCYAIRNNYDRNIYVATAVIDLYAKAGYLLGAHRIFVKCRGKSLIVWTAIISAYAAHGDSDAALRLFYEMCLCGIEPDSVTFTAMLSACAHAGIVNEALQIFESMLLVYGIHPCVEHYACMVGALSRAGMHYEALRVILKMPVEPSAKVWGALLNGVSVSGDVELGKFVCDHLFEIEPHNSWNYITLANLYSRAGRWEEAERIREKMKNMGLKKIPGCSWIETSSGLLSFTAGDVSNDLMEEIYVVLEVLMEIIRGEGYTTTIHLNEDDNSIVETEIG